MREAAPPVFPVFRSRLTTAVLARAYIGDGEYSVADMARAAGTDTGTMTREIKRLEAAAVVRSRMVGRTKLVRANREAPFYRSLRDLVVIVLGPAQVLGEEVARLDGVSAAGIFGSWAARVAGEEGPSPVDIDLLVIGRPDRDDLHDAVGRARARLGRDINTVVVSASRWENGDDPFLAELRSRPLIALSGIPGPDVLAAARSVDRIRITRHEAEYPGQATYIDQDAVLDDLPKAEAVVEAVAKALPHLSPFTT